MSWMMAERARILAPDDKFIRSRGPIPYIRVLAVSGPFGLDADPESVRKLDRIILPPC